MNSYLALIRTNLRLSFRDRGLIFFNYLFPFMFFFLFGQMMKADQSGMINQVVNMVLTIGVLGSGLWGQGMRTITDREQNILRRFKVAPITPLPILVSSIIVGLVHYIPVFVIVLTLAHFIYGMAVPTQLPSLFLLVIAGLLAFRGVGLIAASVVNSMQESQILIQILYMPMLFLSGATIPMFLMPVWLQTLSQFLPATHFFGAMQAILLAQESVAKHVTAVLALLLTAVVGTFIGMKLFRWEKDEKLPASSKLWVVGVLAPFILLGCYQAYSKENVAKMRSLDRLLERSESVLFKDARIFVGDGTVIESGSVLVRSGKIADIFTGAAPDAKTLHAAEVQANGKTLVPAFVDVAVNLKQSGGVFEKPEDGKTEAFVERALANYLYSGVAAVGNVAGNSPELNPVLAKLSSGQRLGADPIPVDLRNAKAVVPMLAAQEAVAAWRDGRADPLNRPLVEQAGPPSLLKATKAALKPHPEAPAIDLDQAKAKLKQAWESGAILAAGSGAGAPLAFHGPLIHRELQLWVQAGIPARVALQAATANAAKLLGVDSHTGYIRKGYDASLVLLDGNPLEEIGTTERISSVMFKGERVRRADLFDQK